mmetsp:Transcript_16170/g.29323  ORF Transcript_16170/g.29323 Transcript_16170/m.29323 type:complete len:86 (-) Transcript_16170:98-355(-)
MQGGAVGGGSTQLRGGSGEASIVVVPGGDGVVHIWIVYRIFSWVNAAAWRRSYLSRCGLLLFVLSIVSTTAALLMDMVTLSSSFY